LTDQWPAPGRGDWTRLADHFDRPFTAEYERIFAASFEVGMAAYAALVGLPARTIALRTVHGYPFLHPAPLVGPDVSRNPPRALLWLLVRLVPAYRRRNRTARDALRDRPWRAIAQHYLDVERAEAIAANEALSAVDPAQLTDAELAAHLEACEAHAIAGYRRHFELHATDMFPVGLYLAACRAIGIDVAVALDLLIDGIGSERAAAPRPAGFDQCIVGGYDLDRPRLCEVAAARTHDADRCAATDGPGAAGRCARIDALVPDAERARIGTLLADAQLVHPVRDDNGLVLGAWRIGLLRRAYLEAGRRLGTDLVVEATVPELVAALTGVALDVEPLARRAAERRSWSHADVPLRLGTESLPPLDAFPPALRATVEALLLLRDLSERAPGNRLQGTGIGSQSVTGIARVVTGADDAIDRIEAGDVLVATVTSPAFNAVLPFAAALVVEHGGLVSHAALVARELGIPAIVGVRDATRLVRDGDLVHVDAASGLVLRVDEAHNVEAAPSGD
jgi:pyruvate,water dikinase